MRRTLGNAALLQRRCPCTMRQLLFDPEPRVTCQPGRLNRVPGQLPEGPQALYCFLPKRGYPLAHNDLDDATLDKYARTKYFVRVQFDAGSK